MPAAERLLATADGQVLALRRQTAVAAFLRDVADSELVAEEARCRLCEARGFDLYGAFLILQQLARLPRGGVGANEIHAWMAARPPRGDGTITLKDVNDMLEAYVDPVGELRYEGFLRMVLPRDQRNAWLKEALLCREARSSSRWRQEGSTDSSEVSCRLHTLLEIEMRYCRNLMFHRRVLEDLSIDVWYLSSLFHLGEAIGSSAELVHTDVARNSIVHELRALTSEQFDAVLRRVNPVGGCLFSAPEFFQFFLPRRTCIRASLKPSLYDVGPDAVTSRREDVMPDRSRSLVDGWGATRPLSPREKYRSEDFITGRGRTLGGSGRATHPGSARTGSAILGGLPDSSFASARHSRSEDSRSLSARHATVPCASFEYLPAPPLPEPSGPTVPQLGRPRSADVSLDPTTVHRRSASAPMYCSDQYEEVAPLHRDLAPYSERARPQGRYLPHHPQAQHVHYHYHYCDDHRQDIHSKEEEAFLQKSSHTPRHHWPRRPLSASRRPCELPPRSGRPFKSDGRLSDEVWRASLRGSSKNG